MTIKLTIEDVLTRDVEIQTPTGNTLTVKDVKFTYMSEEHFLKLAKLHGDDAINPLVLDWGEFLDAADEKIEFSEENKTELLAVRYAQAAFVTTYTRAIMGADSKNFLSSLALGRMANTRAAKKQNKAKKKQPKRSKGSSSRKSK